MTPIFHADLRWFLDGRIVTMLDTGDRVRRSLEFNALSIHIGTPSRPWIWLAVSSFALNRN